MGTTFFKKYQKMQEALGSAVKTASNPSFESKYADYNEVVETVKNPLNDNGLVYYHISHTNEGGKPCIRTIIQESEGTDNIYIDIELILGKPDMQALGSAITFARRYGLSAITGLQTEDDDGNQAAKSTTTTATKQTKDEAVRQYISNSTTAEDLEKTEPYISTLPEGHILRSTYEAKKISFTSKKWTRPE